MKASSQNEQGTTSRALVESSLDSFDSRLRFLYLARRKCFNGAFAVYVHQPSIVWAAAWISFLFIRNYGVPNHNIMISFKKYLD